MALYAPVSNCRNTSFMSHFLSPLAGFVYVGCAYFAIFTFGVVSLSLGTKQTLEAMVT